MQSLSRRLGLLSGLLGLLPSLLAAQQPAAGPSPAPVLGSYAAQPQLPVDWSVYRFQSGGEPLLPAPADTLPCPQCHPKKYFWVAAGELMLAQLIPWGVNGPIRGKEWAQIGPSSWEENFENPWVWDNNAFLNNQFSHPYHGNLYFNAARSNGYNFWASAPWAMAGSLMWEMFFEVWAPAPNDWLNTSFGGINLGEVTYRLSGLVLKNEATGTNRALRETGAFLIDPFRGFNRLIRGEMTGQSQTPADWRPSLIQGSIDVGYRQASQSGQLSGPTTANQGIIDFTLWYGSLMRDIRSAPFSHFRLYAELAGNDSVSKLATLETRGTLGGKTIRETDNNLQVLGVMMNYDYWSNPIVEYGAQSFSGGWISGWNAGAFRVQTQLMARATVIGATKSDYYDVTEGRNYDYGAGLGGQAQVAASLPGRLFARARYITLWAPTINGASGSHVQRAALAEVRGIFLGRVGVGARFQWYESQGIYDNLPDVTRYAHAFTIFASWVVPRWTDDE
jgi:hypothetical protein